MRKFSRTRDSSPAEEGRSAWKNRGISRGLTPENVQPGLVSTQQVRSWLLASMRLPLV
jgi:hypothetical protein